LPAVLAAFFAKQVWHKRLWLARTASPLESGEAIRDFEISYVVHGTRARGDDNDAHDVQLAVVRGRSMNS
jgi:predicted nucleotidyltransferase